VRGFQAGQRAGPRPRWQLPTCRTGSGKAIPGSCTIRRPREGCSVFGVHSDTVSACTMHPVGLGETAGMPPVTGFPAFGHGPCHRPACPSCGSRDRRSLVITKDAKRLSNDHSGLGQSSEGRFLSAVSPRPRRHPRGNGMVRRRPEWCQGPRPRPAATTSARISSTRSRSSCSGVSRR